MRVATEVGWSVRLPLIQQFIGEEFIEEEFIEEEFIEEEFIEEDRDTDAATDDQDGEPISRLGTSRSIHAGFALETVAY